jgi:transcription-repair coupling factor (superfamily II helicase)
MLINRVATHLLTAPELQDTMRTLADGDDASLSVAQSARTLLSAAIWAHDPRPTLLVVPGEENADRMANALFAWLGHASVCRFPERKDWPWSDKPADDAVIGARCHALDLLAKGENCLVVASARSLLRRVPPKGSGFYEGAVFEVGEEVEFEDMGRLLVSMGYADTGETDAPGTFHIHGDLVDIYPAQATSAVRIEFFGDEIDRIRRMVPATGQTIQDLDSVSIVPAREIAFTDETITKATISLMHRLADDKNVEADLELIKERAQAPHLDKYLPDLYGGKTSTPI